MDEENESGFTFRDRRRIHLDTDDASTPPAPGAADTADAAPPASQVPQAPPMSPMSSISPETETTAPDASGFPEWSEDEQDGGSGELPDVYSVLALFLNELRGLAWIRMGLVANPATNMIERDLEQARVAIDTVAFLGEQLEKVVPPSEVLPLRALINDLRMNFVEQSKRGNA